MDATQQSEQVSLIIAIDVGTSNAAAAAYGFSNHHQRSTYLRLGELPTDYFHFIQFPSHHDTSDQEKSQMASWSERNDFLWGDEIDQAFHNGNITEPNRRIELLKHALDTRDEKRKRQRAVIQGQLDDLADECGVVSALDLIRVFCEKLLAHILYNISFAYGGDVVARAKMDFILSVPALWEFEQREMIIQAAQKAGIPPPKLVSEREAATVFCMHECLMRKPALYDAAIRRIQVGGSRDIIPKTSERWQLKTPEGYFDSGRRGRYGGYLNLVNGEENKKLKR